MAIFADEPILEANHHSLSKNEHTNIWCKKTPDRCKKTPERCFLTPNIKNKIGTENLQNGEFYRTLFEIVPR